jgi:hypothetical protein
VQLRQWYDFDHRFDSVVLILDKYRTGENFRIDSIEFFRGSPTKAVIFAAWQRFFGFEDYVPARALIKIALILLIICAIYFLVRSLIWRERITCSDIQKHMRRTGAAVILGTWFFMGAWYISEEWFQISEDARFMAGLKENGRASVILSDIQHNLRKDRDTDFLRFGKYCNEVIPPLTPVLYIVANRPGLHGFSNYYFFPLVLYDPAKSKMVCDYAIVYKVEPNKIEKYASANKFFVYKKFNEHSLILKRKGR